MKASPRLVAWSRSAVLYFAPGHRGFEPAALAAGSIAGISKHVRSLRSDTTQRSTRAGKRAGIRNQCEDPLLTSYGVLSEMLRPVN